jgi:hypothetical protein
MQVCKLYPAPDIQTAPHAQQGNRRHSYQDTGTHSHSTWSARTWSKWIGIRRWWTGAWKRCTGTRQTGWKEFGRGEHKNRGGRQEYWRGGQMEKSTGVRKTWDTETWRHGHREMDKETWTRRHGHGDMDMVTKPNGTRKIRRCSFIRLPFAHRANGSLTFVRLLTKNDEVIRLQTD